MKALQIKSKLGTGLSKMKFGLRKASPEILLIAGIVGTVGSVVLACKATLKATEVLGESKTEIDTIHEVAEASEKKETEIAYSDEDRKRDLVVVWTKTSVKLAKIYAPAVVLGTLSIASIVGSNVILRKRNAALAASYAIIDKSFKEYRARAVERFGEEVDKELRYGIKAVEVKETVVDENGKKKTVKSTVNAIDPTAMPSDYARYFDEVNPYYDSDHETNLRQLKLWQARANDRLKTQKYLFLNEVYDMMGFPPSRAGQVVGWIYDEDNPIGDNYIDFGIYDLYNANSRDFVNMRDKIILLDFNVDGPILERAIF